MENKIKNPVSKKNIFFFNIFNRLIDSIENYVHKTEEDTFAKNFDILNVEGEITVSPKGSTVEKLVLGDGYSALKIDDGNFIAHVDINNEDGIVELYSRRNNKEARTILDNKSIYYGFDENYITTGGVKFDKNGIAVTTNNTTYKIYEPQLSTIVNACEYSYDEDNSTYKLKMLPKVDNINFANTPLVIDFGKSDDIDLKLQCIDSGLEFSGIKNNDSIGILSIKDRIGMLVRYISNNTTIKETIINIHNDTNEADIEITHKNDSGETNADQVLKFIDQTNSLEVTFTVAELIALKALLQTT